MVPELHFKEWLEIEESLQQENWRNWAKGATLGLAALGSTLGGNQWINAPQVAKDQVAQTWHDSTPKDTAIHTHGGLSRLGLGHAAKIKLSSGAIEHKLSAAKAWAKKHFNVSDNDVKVVKASDYLKKVWGDKWQTVLDQARQHKSNQPGMPNLDRLDEPIVMVRSADPEFNDAHGSCRQWGTGNETVSVCSVNPSRWGHTDTSREELTHSMQGDVQGRVAGSDKYAASTNEFAAKLSELKRAYYQNTGEIANDAEELFNWAIFNSGKVPEAAKTLLYYYAGERDEEKQKQIIQHADSILGGLVQSGSGNVSGLV